MLLRKAASFWRMVMLLRKACRAALRSPCRCSTLPMRSWQMEKIALPFGVIWIGGGEFLADGHAVAEGL